MSEPTPGSWPVAYTADEVERAFPSWRITRSGLIFTAERRDGTVIFIRSAPDLAGLARKIKDVEKSLTG